MGLELSQLWLGERRGTPWTQQSITGLTASSLKLICQSSATLSERDISEVCNIANIGAFRPIMEGSLWMVRFCAVHLCRPLSVGILPKAPGTSDIMNNKLILKYVDFCYAHCRAWNCSRAPDAVVHSIDFQPCTTQFSLHGFLTFLRAFTLWPLQHDHKFMCMAIHVQGSHRASSLQQWCYKPQLWGDP